MTILELKKLSLKELIDNLEESRKELRKFRFDLSFGKVKNIRAIRSLKKKIAQIMTILNDKKN